MTPPLALSPPRPQRTCGPALGLLLALAGLCVLGGALSPAAWAQGSLKPRTLEPWSSADEIKSSRQRALADELARRHLGTPLREGETRDLTTLQRLLDGDWIEREDVFSQQAVGVALGDVMARNLGLHWVVVDDDYGRSRALRWEKEDDLFFPVTMVSKRIGQRRSVDVYDLYDFVADRVATLKARAVPKRRGRVTLPPRPEKTGD